MSYRNWNHTVKNGVVVMGILNATPDSFSDGGSYETADDAVKKALIMEEQGAGIIDVGGESTRPGFTPVPEEEEIRRVVPVVEGIRKKSDIVISVDTTKAGVAKAALDAGADIINDIACLNDEKLGGVVADAGCGYVLMHNRYDRPYNDFYTDYINDLKDALDRAFKLGIKKENIILDPGVGFAKDYGQNLTVIKHLKELKDMGYPVLLGISKKSVIGNCLNVPIPERLAGTLALDSFGILNGADIIRVHDVKEHVETVKMLQAVINAE